MLDRKIMKQSLGYAAGVVIYVAVVAVFMSKAEQIFGQDDSHVLMPMSFLLLLVVSVATVGLLIFGKPVMLYIDGQKREGITMAMSTVISLAIFTSLLLVVLALM